jgi:hypothetical protein
MPYPEHEKLEARRIDIEATLEFLTWLGYKSIGLAVAPDEEGHPMTACPQKPKDLLYEFFDISPERLDEEREAMWAEQQAQQKIPLPEADDAQSP